LRAASWVFVLLFCQSLKVWPAAQRPAGSAEEAASSITATSWPEADRLFRSDPFWLGGDAAFSVDLGGGRVLWLFGDSFIATKPGETRRQATFVCNSAAIETGYDPARASIRFYTGQRLGKSSSFVPSEDANWFWPMQGIRLGNHLLLFDMRLKKNPDKHSLGFQSVGWNAFLVKNPNAEPSQWKLRKLDGPETQGRMLIGMSVIRYGGSVYAFDLNDVNHDAYLLRWPVDEAAAGRLSSPQWWCGDGEGWQSDPAHRQVVIPNAGSEFSVQRDPRGGFLEVAGLGFGASSVVLRRAPRLEGPWSKPQPVYRPPESDAPHPFVYGEKAHPELRGADLIVTYAANGSDERLATDMSIYFPRFVRITFGSDSKNNAVGESRRAERSAANATR
jgi:hypothetical protein